MATKYDGTDSKCIVDTDNSATASKIGNSNNENISILIVVAIIIIFCLGHVF